jgi:hypothetical protein
MVQPQPDNFRLLIRDERSCRYVSDGTKLAAELENFLSIRVGIGHDNEKIT